MKDYTEKLNLWQGRLYTSDSAMKDEIRRMDEREYIYNGRREIDPLTRNFREEDGSMRRTPHQRKIAFELVEAQVSTAIPQPHVAAMRKQDEPLAEKIEHLLRQEIDRLPMERMNDLAERIVPVQGVVGFLVEWDNAVENSESVGDLTVSVIHPKQIAPQPGVSEIDNMDWFILKIPSTKAAIRRKYGVDIDAEAESEPDMRGNPLTHVIEESEDAVTVYTGYERTDSGFVNKFTWVNDTALEDLENYQARRQPVCRKCGKTRPFYGQIVQSTVPDRMAADGVGAKSEEDPTLGMDLAAFMADGNGLAELPEGEPEEPKEKEYRGGACPWCGADDWTDKESDYEEIWTPMIRAGLNIPGMHAGRDKDGNPAMIPTLIPYYRPDRYPLILQKSVSVYGRLFGTSDIDQIRDQQNTMNALSMKIGDRIFEAGTVITLPPDARITTDPKDGRSIHVENPANLAMIKTLQFEGDLSSEFEYYSAVYEEARQTLGITNSFQGREDTTAKSGVAKQFSAAQSAGRLESKRMMKYAAAADLYQSMFLFWLAYADEPRTVSFRDRNGDTQYEQISRYDFLVDDGDGRYHWNTDFLFSCDAADTLAANREAMWQETRGNLQSGAFGDPTQLDTLILFWTKMEALHYPDASSTRKYLEDKLEQQRRAQEMQMQMAAQQNAAMQALAQPMTPTQEAMRERENSQTILNDLPGRGNQNNGSPVM